MRCSEWKACAYSAVSSKEPLIVRLRLVLPVASCVSAAAKLDTPFPLYSKQGLPLRLHKRFNW